jgi:L-amino acid N-acyltransferase YncA
VGQNSLGQPFSHRIARLDDLEAIVAIYNATIPSRQVTADLEPISVESRVAWFEAHSPATRPLWVTQIDGTTAAWLSFSSFYGRPAYDRTAEISIYVAEKFRRHGLGRYLLNTALTASPRLKIDTLLGFIFGHNTPSLALFERDGFARWGVLPRVAVLDDMERDLVIVGRRVNE